MADIRLGKKEGGAAEGEGGEGEEEETTGRKYNGLFHTAAIISSHQKMLVSFAAVKYDVISNIIRVTHPLPLLDAAKNQ